MTDTVLHLGPEDTLIVKLPPVTDEQYERSLVAFRQALPQVAPHRILVVSDTVDFAIVHKESD